MSNFSLTPYTIRLRQKRSSEYLNLSDLPDVHVDILGIFYEYLNSVLPKLPIDATAKEHLKVEFANKKHRTITGRFKGGVKGYGAELRDVNLDSLSYERKLSDAEFVPYYFLIRIPTKTEKGILVLQKFRNLGIRNLFASQFQTYLRSKIGDNYILEISPLIPAELIKKYLQGRIVKLRLIKQGFPKDIFDVAEDAMPDDEEFNGDCEVVISARRNGSIPGRFRRLISQKLDHFLESNNASVGSLIEVKNFDYNTIKIKVRVGDNYRTVNISDLNKIKYSEDISGLDKDLSGHPKFDIIDDRAKEFLADLAASVWGGNIDV